MRLAKRIKFSPIHKNDRSTINLDPVGPPLGDKRVFPLPVAREDSEDLKDFPVSEAAKISNLILAALVIYSKTFLAKLFLKDGDPRLEHILGATVATLCYLRWKRLPILKFADILAPSIALGAFFGRLGCFMNGCCYGRACDLPWAIRFPETNPTHGQPVHPTQIYEALALFFFGGEVLHGFAFTMIVGIITGTYSSVFIAAAITDTLDGYLARKGYALNRMCYSFNSADNRAEFKRDEDAYCRRYELNDEQRAAIASRNVLQLIAAGGNIYYLAKFAGILGLDVQDVGAQQTGMTKDAFKAMLVAAGK